MKERTRLRNAIKGLLKLQGIRELIAGRVLLLREVALLSRAERRKTAVREHVASRHSVKPSDGATRSPHIPSPLTDGRCQLS